MILETSKFGVLKESSFSIDMEIKLSSCMHSFGIGMFGKSTRDFSMLCKSDPHIKGPRLPCENLSQSQGSLYVCAKSEECFSRGHLNVWSKVQVDLVNCFKIILQQIGHVTWMEFGRLMLLQDMHPVHCHFLIVLKQ